jgi:N-acetylneuraminic acid mutarotase
MAFGVSAADAQVTWQDNGAMLNGRAQAAITADAGGNIYLLGGYTSAFGPESALSSVDIYNPVSQTWTSGPAMPVAARGATAVYLNNSIYVFGGYNTGQRAIYQALNLTTNTWTQGSLFGGSWEPTAAVVNNRIFVLGGEDSKNSTREFFPSTGTFTSLANNPNGSFASRAVAFGGLLYLVGATTSYTPDSTRLDIFDPSTNTWSTAPADGLLARTQFAAGNDSQYIYVAGGSSTGFNDTAPFYTDFSIYNTATDSWSTSTALPVGLRESAGIVVNGRFYVFGGFKDGGGLSSEIYSIAAIPEPSTFALLATGAAALAVVRRRRNR